MVLRPEVSHTCSIGQKSRQLRSLLPTPGHHMPPACQRVELNDTPRILNRPFEVHGTDSWILVFTTNIQNGSH